MENGDIMLDNGEIVQAPSGDEPMPAEEDPPLTMPPPSDIVHSIKDPRYAAQMDVALPKVQTPRGPGDPLDAPSPKEARTSRETGETTVELYLKDFGLPPLGDKAARLNATQEDRDRAIKYPPLG